MQINRHDVTVSCWTDKIKTITKCAKFRQKFFRENNMSKSNTLTAARLNFLYQSANLISSPETNSIKVAHHYTQLMVNISQKAVQRLSKDLKRTICKRCKGLLKPGVTAKVGKEGKKIGSICQLCQAKKQFPIQCKGSKKKSKKKSKWVQRSTAIIYAN